MNSIVEIVLMAILTLPTCSGHETGCDAIQTPKLSVKTTSMETFEKLEPWWMQFEALYGDDVLLICSAGDTLSLRIQKGERNLGMNENGTYLNTEEVNSTTIRYEIRLPNVGTHRYRCVDTVTRCEDNLYLVISPVVSVVSANVRHKIDENEMHLFFVPLGETYQILCTGGDVGSLSIENTRTLEILATTNVNETTVSHEGRADAIGVMYCRCRRVIFALIVGYPLVPPEQFRCTSYNWNKITCTWRSLRTTNTYNLYYTDEYGHMKLLCSERRDGTNRVCTWNNRDLKGELILFNAEYLLVMQTCNDIFCNNQTVRITHIEIVKLDPVADLRILETGARSAVASWRAHEDNWIFRYVYKVEYRLLASRWRQVNASSVQCSHIECGIDLNLECPDHHYELRVCVRYKEAAEDRLWSEPASVYFFTRSQGADEAIDPVCRSALQEPEPITSSEAALSEIGKLIRHTIKRKTAFKKKVRDLGPKLAKIKALRDYLAASSADL